MSAVRSALYGQPALPHRNRVHRSRFILYHGGWQANLSTFSRITYPKTPPEPRFLATTLENLDLAVLAYVAPDANPPRARYGYATEAPAGCIVFWARV